MVTVRDDEDAEETKMLRCCCFWVTKCFLFGEVPTKALCVVFFALFLGDCKYCK